MEDTIDQSLLTIFDACNNWGRWGDDDELGTLNYIDAEKRISAAELVRTGLSISMSRPLDTKRSNVNVIPMSYHMMKGGAFGSLHDYIGVACHGFAFTHIDAISHGAFRGTMYNGRKIAEVASHEGATFGSMMPQRDGIFTRGVLLDVARARGVDWFEPDRGVTVEDLEAAEAFGNVKVRRGDALFVRVGLAKHEAAIGHALDIPPRSGVLPETIPWMHEREIAVFGGDCVEKVPCGTQMMPMPLHQIGIVSMGLILLDWPEVERLAEYCLENERHEFLLTAAGLLIPGGTGSIVNPIATF